MSGLMKQCKEPLPCGVSGGNGSVSSGSGESAGGGIVCRSLRTEKRRLSYQITLLIWYNASVAYTYTITVPLKLQVVALQDNQILTSRDINFVVEFESKTPIKQADISQAELYLQGKPFPADTELIRCVKHIADTCMAESKPMVDTLYTLRPHFPKVKTAVVLDGNIRWTEKRVDKTFRE
jgi:hypothetical protein